MFLTTKTMFVYELEAEATDLLIFWSLQLLVFKITAQKPREAPSAEQCWITVKQKRSEVVKMRVFLRASEVHGDIWRDRSSRISIILYFVASWHAAVINGIRPRSTFEPQAMHCCIASWDLRSWRVQPMDGILSFPWSGINKIRGRWNLCLMNLSVFSAVCFVISYKLPLRSNHPNMNCQHQHILFIINNFKLCWYQSLVAWGCASVFPWIFSSDCPADKLHLSLHQIISDLAIF